MNIETMKQQNADLRVALQHTLQSLEYIESAYPDIAGKAKRVEDIQRAQALLNTTKVGADPLHPETVL